MKDFFEFKLNIFYIVDFLKLRDKWKFKLVFLKRLDDNFSCYLILILDENLVYIVLKVSNIRVIFLEVKWEGIFIWKRYGFIKIYIKCRVNVRFLKLKGMIIFG